MIESDPKFNIWIGLDRIIIEISDPRSTLPWSQQEFDILIGIQMSCCFQRRVSVGNEDQFCERLVDVPISDNVLKAFILKPAVSEVWYRVNGLFNLEKN